MTNFDYSKSELLQILMMENKFKHFKNENENDDKWDLIMNINKDLKIEIDCYKFV